MILVTTGTNEQPFDRLVDAARLLDGDEPLFVQHGSSQVEHGAGEWVDFLPFEELADRMRAARVVVCHAGVGSIILARRCGHRPVVLPRRLALGEAVDDHQVELGRRLHRAGIVTLVEDAAALHAAVADPLAQRPGEDRRRGALDLSTAVLEQLQRMSVRPCTLDHQAGTPVVPATTVSAR